MVSKRGRLEESEVQESGRERELAREREASGRPGVICPDPDAAE